MELRCQKEALTQLRDLSLTRRQSILIEGSKGSGKSYCARQYSSMISANDFIEVAPKVSDVREALDACINIETPIVILVENLDLGVPGASYTLLKSLEEPQPNVYIVITCRNMHRVPDTILSRSAIVSINPPTRVDIDTYAELKDAAQTKLCRQHLIWQAVCTLSDVDAALSLNIDQIMFYDGVDDFCKFKDSISTLVWNIGHYKDNKEANVEFIIRLMMRKINTPFATKCCIDALIELNQNRIASHAVLSALMFNLKYCE